MERRGDYLHSRPQTSISKFRSPLERASEPDDPVFVEELADDLQAHRQAFAEPGQITDAYRDQPGEAHDLVFLRVPLGRSWQWSRW